MKRILIFVLLASLASQGQNTRRSGNRPQQNAAQQKAMQQQQTAATAQAAAAAKVAAQEAKDDALWTTNFHQMPIDPLRRIGGLTVAANGAGWAKFWGKVVSTEPEGLLVAGSYSRGPRPPSMSGNGDDAAGGYTNVALAFSGTFLVTNFPQGRRSGDTIRIAEAWWARLSGVARISGTNVHRLDYGEAMVMTEEEKAAAKAAAQEAVENQRQALADKALKANQDAADKGDSYGQFRMGERYRDGDGVAKDPAKAREYFAQAAAQGDSQAASALQRLNGAAP